MLESNEPVRQFHQSICIDQLARIGDDVIVTFDKSPDSSYSWGAFRETIHLDGMRGKIVDRETRIDYLARVGHDRSSGLKPGVYEAPARFVVLFENGERHPMEMGNLDWIADHTRIHAERLAERKGIDWRVEHYGQYKFISELPDLPFWELDQVKPSNSGLLEDRDDETFHICKINYYLMENKKPAHWDDDHPGRPYSPWIFDLESSAGYNTTASALDIELVKRGNCWRFYNNEPLEFESIEQEVQFAICMAKYEEVRCPETGNYNWQGPNTFLRGIRDGIIDSIRVGGLFGSKMVRGYKFIDLDLGKRVAAKTLEGFGVFD